MTRVLLEVVAAMAACFAALGTGAICWRVARRVTGDLNMPATRRRLALLGFLPFWFGCLAGMATLSLLSRHIFSEDRFHSLQGALLVGFSPLLAGLVYLVADLLMPPVFGVVSGLERKRLSPRGRMPVLLGAQLITAVIVVLAGVRFPILSVGPDTTLILGSLAIPATVVWLVVATLFVKLLDGLDGAALFLLLFASIAVCSTTAFTTEHFLNAYSGVLIGAVVGSLWFHIHPARIQQSGGTTAFVGFMFALLTVLARQKTVAALAIVMPVALVVLLVGGLILTRLEQSLLLKKDEE